jgi:hypothetical protein
MTCAHWHTVHTQKYSIHRGITATATAASVDAWLLMFTILPFGQAFGIIDVLELEECAAAYHSFHLAHCP